ncbi:MAG: GNAT family N-acetyltransferase [Ruminiclostridium sp.]|nr:GNAT family N-acetyltransferase [Ruminiclostridium sp.]
MTIKQITNKTEKETISRQILEALPEWFGIPEAREEYISDSKEQIMLAAKENGKSLGFICLKETGKATVELAVMGVLKEFHRQGIGRSLFNSAKEIAAQNGYSFMQVKTVQMGRYKEYDETNLFYLSVGFKEFEVFPTLWDEWNPCQIYVMSLK